MTGEFDGAAVAGSGATVGELFRSRAQIQLTDTAIEYQGRTISYGQLKLLPVWDPLRGDPRFEKIVASLAPN